MNFLLSGAEYIYLSTVNITGSYGFSIILFSCLTSLITYPFVKIAGKFSAWERVYNEILSPQLEHLKSLYTGKALFIRKQALFKRYSYNPIFSILGIAPLLVQVPFLILAFYLFSDLPSLKGQGFFVIPDLGASDQLISRANMLPFLMLSINFIASFLMPFFSLTRWLQAGAVNILFFFLLYSAPSAIILYWVTNNFILLVKNIYQYSFLKEQKELKLLWKNIASFILKIDFIISLFIIIFYSLFIRYFLDVEYSGQLIVKDTVTFLITLISAALIFRIWTRQKNKWNETQQVSKKIRLFHQEYSWQDLSLLLIPLAPIAQYIIYNRDIMKISDILLFLGINLIAGLIVAAAIPYFLKRYISIALLFPMTISLLYLYAALPIFSLSFHWGNEPDRFLPSVIFLTTTALFFYLRLKFQSLLFFLAVLYFSANSINAYMQLEDDTYHITKKSIRTYDYFLPKGNLKKKPDIYLLTYDAYVSNKVMLKYGINNKSQEDFLRSNGFVIYPKTYSLGGSTLVSMSRVLDIRDAGLLPVKARRMIGGDNLTTNILKKQGYKTHAVLGRYFVLYEKNKYDYFFPKITAGNVGYKILFRGLQEQRFKFDIMNHFDKHTKEEWIQKKRKIMSEQTIQPKFLYTHTGPYHSQDSGVCTLDETELFHDRLKKTNVEMRDDVNTILESNREAIIIVNGDHGPYLTKDCRELLGYSMADISKLDLQDRFGAFLAIRWPDKKYKKYDDIQTIQEIFEVVFKYLYETNTVLKKKLSSKTMDINSTLAGGMVENGIIMRGKDKGKPLYAPKEKPLARRAISGKK